MQSVRTDLLTYILISHKPPEDISISKQYMLTYSLYSHRQPEEMSGYTVLEKTCWLTAYTATSNQKR